MGKSPYTEAFFEERIDSLVSARVIVPLVLSYVEPKSVLDVGCGTGAFLSIFKERGVQDIFGVDGEWVQKKQLVIPETSFKAVNLEEPLRLGRKFDLVVSSEVAEHLHERCAELFVASLVLHGDTILFSAAIPFQGGTHHVNEQWPEYWARLFLKHGFVPVDCLRKKLWDANGVRWWYAQNLLIFMRKEILMSHPLLQKECENTAPLSLVHPTIYRAKAEQARRYQKIISFIPFKKAILKLLGML